MNNWTVWDSWRVYHTTIINKYKFFNFNNLNIPNKNENLINIIILNMNKCNYKTNVIFSFCWL